MGTDAERREVLEALLGSDELRPGVEHGWPHVLDATAHSLIAAFTRA